MWAPRWAWIKESLGISGWSKYEPADEFTKHNSHGCSALKFSKYEFIYTPNASVHAQEEYESEADKMLKVYKV